jgi:hypothetical protein
MKNDTCGRRLGKWVALVTWAFALAGTAVAGPNTPQAPTQRWSLSRAGFAAGAGICTNGSITMLATCGQAMVGGPLTGGGFTVTAGSLARVAVVHTAGAPLLTLTGSAGNIVLSWVGPAAGYRLQECATLGNGSWVDLNVVVIDDGNTRRVMLRAAA